MSKPFIAAAENNKGPIVAALQPLLADAAMLLELGAGTGQHAVHGARSMPQLVWQTSDVAARLPGIRAWVEEAALPNLPAPLELDVSERPWPLARCDAVYSANTAHFMPWPAVASMFAGVAEVLAPAGVFALYGPFNYGGRYLSAGNRALDAWLATLDPAYAIRDFEALAELAARHRLQLCEDVPMPANNRLLIWRREC